MPSSTQSIIIHLTIIFALLSYPAVHAQPANGDAFGNWLVNCETDAENGRQGCFLVQNLVLREGGQRVLQIAIGFVAETPEPIALISLPLGISLPPGTTLKIDELDPTRIAVERCEPNGCRAGVKLGAELLQNLISGDQLSITFYDAKRQPIDVPLSLKGIEEGLAALSEGKS